MERKNQIKNVLNFCKISEEAKIPYRATEGSAGMDLYACMENEVTLNPGGRAFISCGIAISLPGREYVALVFARSGLSIKHGITLSNGVGVIDSDYRGDIGIGLCNLSDTSYTIKPGDRIAQLLIMKVENLPIEEVSSLDSTSRGSKGFGSTGK